jgi:3-methyladenine DNA glycosylase/8-oxoguanine DNA glycosylase
VAIGDPDAVPVGDYHLPHTVGFALEGTPRSTDERMLELLEPYSGQRGRVIRLIMLAGITAPKFGPRKPLRNIVHS